MILNYDKRSLLRYLRSVNAYLQLETTIFLCDLTFRIRSRHIPFRPRRGRIIALSRESFRFNILPICFPAETPSSAGRSLCVRRQLDAAYRAEEKARKCSEMKRNRTKREREREHEYARLGGGVAAGARQRKRKRKEANERRRRAATLHTFEIERLRRSSQSVTILLQGSVNGLHQGEAVFH